MVARGQRANDPNYHPSRTSKSKSPSRRPAAKPTTSGTPTKRSPARKSPARKSPSRKRSSDKSPARRSPARRSPARKNLDVSDSPVRTLSGRTSIKSIKLLSATSVTDTRTGTSTKTKSTIDAESDSDNGELEYKYSNDRPKATVRGRARRIESEYTVLSKTIQSPKEPTPVERDITNYVNLVRRSTRRSQSNDTDRIVHSKLYEPNMKKLTEFSDEDDVPYLRSSIVREKSERYSESRSTEDRFERKEFGGWIGALCCIILTPLIILVPNVICDEKQCSITKLPNFGKYKSIEAFLDYDALAFYSGYVLLMAFLSALPFGGPKVNGLPNKQGKLSYRLNGTFVLICTSSALIALEYLNVPVVATVLDKYFQIVVSSLVVSFLVAIYLYVRSFYVSVSALNPHAISNSQIYNFWIGREINPRILNVIDMKVLFYRITLSLFIHLNAIYVYSNIRLKLPVSVENVYSLSALDFNPTLLVLAALEFVCAMDYFIFEETLLTTFEVQYEGCGFMSSVLYNGGPFVLISLSKYVYFYNVRLPAWELAALSTLFCIGYILYRGSNSQKHAFRQNPYNPALSHLESIPTAQGKKLLVSGYWGFVRHPNYLGDMLIILSLAMFARDSVVAWVYLGDIAFLFYRSVRDGQRCKERYGSAWDRYCQRVKYVLIPKVY